MLNSRQVHLDFHTSEHIPGVGAAFDAEVFASTVERANINSITVFARCHHGLIYYQSKQFAERIHPSLGCQDLVIDQVKALHKKNIKAPVYITVQWDLKIANEHPEWLIAKKDGSHEGGPFTQPGFYQSLCLNTGYVDFLKKQTAEVCELLGDELDGIFFDIVDIRNCWCSCCRRDMKLKGIDMEDTNQVAEFANYVTDRFKAQMSELVRGYNSNATVFYNAGHIGPVTKASADAYSHFELESLPSGGWGYLHFPVTARYARTLGKDCMGMTGKFHLSWGDFHSLKSLAALEFECFRMLSYGFACSIGDQLEPRGTLHAAAYDLIGNVYQQIAEREEWARPSVSMAELAVVTPEHVYGARMADSIMGATQMLEELAIQFDIIDPEQDFEKYKMLILPDDINFTTNESKKLDKYVANGGKVIACYKGGLMMSDPENKAKISGDFAIKQRNTSQMGQESIFPQCFGVEAHGDEVNYPCFVTAQGPLGTGLHQGNSYVMYKQGLRLNATSAKPIMSATEPYFSRAGDKFCSHFYTPSAYGDPFPAVYKNGNVIVFAHPIFGQYRETAPYWCKVLISNAINLLQPKRMIAHNGPSTLNVQILDQPDKNRYALHILTYIPVRKSATIDIVEDRTKVTDVVFKLNLSRTVTKATLIPEGVAIPISRDGDEISFSVPMIDGYGIVELQS